jgi:hypothetical protein
MTAAQWKEHWNGLRCCASWTGSTRLIATDGRLTDD